MLTFYSTLCYWSNIDVTVLDLIQLSFVNPGSKWVIVKGSIFAGSVDITVNGPELTISQLQRKDFEVLHLSKIVHGDFSLRLLIFNIHLIVYIHHQCVVQLQGWFFKQVNKTSFFFSIYCVLWRRWDRSNLNQYLPKS